jgi:hypothetical protein
MRIKFDVSAIKQIRWYEFALRFILGGAITVAAALIVKRYGPAVGGLFLAFPAIFPASATLVEKHEKRKRERAGIQGGSRGRMAASLDARGAVMGSIGLMVFALVVWRVLSLVPTGAVLSLAVIAWFATSISLWYGRRLIRS